VLTPPGGKAGSTIEVTISGADVEEPLGLLFSHPGLKAELVVPTEPPMPMPMPMPEATKKRRPAMGTPGVTRFRVTIPADVPVGIHDLRLVGRWGVSTPRAFVVSDQTEVLEKEPNNDVSQTQRIELNTIVNGVISAPTDVDYYSF